MAVENVKKPDIHWNYFLALEADLAQVSRYIEFSKANLGVYSIELAHLLFAAASEVDVLAKAICALASPGQKARNILEYQAMLFEGCRLIEIPHIHTVKISIPRYGLEFTPFDNWSRPQTKPDWWTSYNNVKHKRDCYFHEATLKNAMNSLGALLIMNVFHEVFKYRDTWKTDRIDLNFVVHSLRPYPSLLRLPASFYGALYEMGIQSVDHLDGQRM